MGPIETMVSGLPGQKVNGNTGAAVGPIETMEQVSRAGGHAACFLEALCTEVRHGHAVCFLEAFGT